MSELNIVLLGAGAMGHGWSRAIEAHPGAKLVAFVDPLIGTDRQAPWLQDHPQATKGAALAQLGDLPLDAAVVTTQSPAHAEAIRAALEHGLHVVVEKPFATTLEDAEALVALAEERGLILMVSQNYRFFPGVATLRDIVAQQTYGRIRAVTGQFSYDWAGKPYQHEMEHITALEMSVHHLDLARAIFGADAQSGLSVEWNPAGSQYKRGGGGQEALFVMNDGQGTFPFLYSGNLVGKLPNSEWGGNWRFEFDQATLVVDRLAQGYGLYRAVGDSYDYIGPFSADQGFGPSLDHFIQAINGKTEPWSSGRDNLQTLRMAFGKL